METRAGRNRLPPLIIDEQGYAVKQLRRVEYHHLYCYNEPPDGQGRNKLVHKEKKGER